MRLAPVKWIPQTPVINGALSGFCSPVVSGSFSLVKVRAAGRSAPMLIEGGARASGWLCPGCFPYLAALPVKREMLSSKGRWIALLAGLAAVLGICTLLFATTSRYFARSHLPPAKTELRAAIAHTDENALKFPGGLLCCVPGHQSRTVTITIRPAIPSSMYVDSDAEVDIDVVAKGAEDATSAQETQRLESESFGIVPRDARTLALVKGAAKAKYVITPHGIGEKRLRIFGQYADRGSIDNLLPLSGQEYEDVLNLTVLARPSPIFLGITKETWTALQGVGAAIGVPGLLVLVITRLLDARKTEAEEKKAAEGKNAEDKQKAEDDTG
jgi:hypothetical protein